MVLLLDFPPPTEGVHHSEPNTRAVWCENDLGKGTLYISESVVCWVSSDGRGFSLQYPSIFIHAVSTDINNYPEPCLYLMVDGKITLDAGEQVAANGDGLAEAIDAMNVDEEEEKTNELRFVPDNKNMLDVMFRALLDCQALNPDPDEPEDDDDDGGVMIAPFNIQVANGGEFDEEDYEEEDDQFEDAES